MNSICQSWDLETCELLPAFAIRTWSSLASKMMTRSCYALWPRQIENLHHLPARFTADNADATDFRGFFGLKKDFFSVIRGESKGE